MSVSTPLHTHVHVHKYMYQVKLESERISSIIFTHKTHNYHSNTGLNALHCRVKLCCAKRAGLEVIKQVLTTVSNSK